MESLVFESIPNNEDTVVNYGVSAKRNVPRRFRYVESDARLKPLPLTIHQRNEADLDAKELLTKPNQPVELRIGSGVEQLQRTKRFKSIGFI